MLGAGLRLLFRGGGAPWAAVSLNRSEQMIYDYLQGHPEERHYWQEKVRGVAKSAADDHVAADRLQADLWAYYVERSGVVSPFRETAQREGLRRTSMRNLAEYLIRRWTEPRPKPKRAAEELPPEI
jgi:hypothetical protein